MENGLARRVATLQAELADRDPAALAANTGAEYGNGRFHLNVWGTAVALTFPDFSAVFLDEGKPVDPLTDAILAYYFHTADGTPPAGEWIAFTDLPDGRFYTSAFQGYTGRELGRVFGNDLAAFAATAVACGGRAYEFADRAFLFSALPLVPVLMAGWAGDEDFSPSYRILFDAHTGYHLPTDACAILGSVLTKRLIGKSEKEE